MNSEHVTCAPEWAEVLFIAMGFTERQAGFQGVGDLLILKWL